MLLFAVTAQAEQQVDLGKHNINQWEQRLMVVADIVNPGEKISYLSSAFLDTPYLENSLIGGSDHDEVLVMNLAGGDCFTLLDYVESFRRSDRFSEVINILQQVRYRDGLVSYQNRNHFFSDWQNYNAQFIADVTVEVGQGRSVTVSKQLNRKADGSLWVAGIPVTSRRVHYLPTDQIDQRVIDALLAGDYVGIFSNNPGLDVSHTGIIIKTDHGVVFRHASSKEGLRKVVDSDLLNYLKGTQGIVIYRSK